MKRLIAILVPKFFNFFVGTFFGWGALSKHNSASAAHGKVEKEAHMLGWALTFLVVALIAAVFGFSGLASASAGIAQILFVIFLILFVVAMIARAVRGNPPV